MIFYILVFYVLIVIFILFYKNIKIFYGILWNLEGNFWFYKSGLGVDIIVFSRILKIFYIFGDYNIFYLYIYVIICFLM